MTTIAIVEYGTGNHKSVANALQMVAPKARVRITRDPAELLNADRLVLPGQGAMRSCMASLRDNHLEETLRKIVAQRPVLGICIGMQMLFDFSDEGHSLGLGLMSGRVRALRDTFGDDSSLKVPHMGWNHVWQTQSHPMWTGIADGTHFYFVHSYYVSSAQASLRTATTDYGVSFASAVARDNLFAVQFHPEKSARAGLRLLHNFVDWTP